MLSIEFRPDSYGISKSDPKKEEYVTYTQNEIAGTESKIEKSESESPDHKGRCDWMNPKALQYLMGHSDISVTLNTYTDVNLKDAGKEVARIRIV